MSNWTLVTFWNIERSTNIKIFNLYNMGPSLGIVSFRSCQFLYRTYGIVARCVAGERARTSINPRKSAFDTVYVRAAYLFRKEKEKEKNTSLNTICVRTFIWDIGKNIDAISRTASVYYRRTNFSSKTRVAQTLNKTRLYTFIGKFVPILLIPRVY